MKTNLQTSTLGATLFCISIFGIASTVSLAQSGNEVGRESQRIARAFAKHTYNDSLKKLFVDLEAAKTSEQLRLARTSAMQGFKRALDQDPSYCLPYYNLGVLAEAEDDWIAAIKYFEQFKKFSDKADLSLKTQKKLEYLRGLTTSDSSAAGRKKVAYDEALRKVNALINLGLLKEAISVAARAAEVDSTRWESYALIGAALVDRRLFRDALSFLQQASIRAPADVRSKLSRAIKECEVNIQ
jgi:tetratricopeptide (TPR) repeat protein